jgi:site-specific DNA recombinase
MGVEIDAWHDDQDYSGGNVERPGFLEVIRRIEAGETGGVIVARIDRFARSAPDGGAMVRRILDAGGNFASAQERIDPTTDFGKAMLNIMFVMAELQLDQLKSGWKTAKGRAIGRGAHIGPTPFGYRRLPRGQEGSGKLVPDPASAPAVTKLFRRAAAGVGVSELARYMDEIAPRADGGLWTTSSIGHLLSNRVYLGEVAYGSSDSPLPLRNPRAHEPLIDADAWQAAQRERRPRKKRGTPFVLSGLVRCAACRYVMTGGPGRSCGHLRVYRCQGRHGGGKCPAPSMVVAERLEGWVVEQVKALLAGSEVRAERAAVNAEFARLAEAVSSAEAELDAFMLDLANRETLRRAVRRLPRRPAACARGGRGGLRHRGLASRAAASGATRMGRAHARRAAHDRRRRDRRGLPTPPASARSRHQRARLHRLARARRRRPAR